MRWSNINSRAHGGIISLNQPPGEQLVQIQRLVLKGGNKCSTSISVNPHVEHDFIVEDQVSDSLGLPARYVSLYPKQVVSKVPPLGSQQRHI